MLGAFGNIAARHDRNESESGDDGSESNFEHLGNSRLVDDAKLAFLTGFATNAI